ncbi:MAG: tetratricopeptide repeat protein, partial [Marinicella sp.]
TLDGRTPLENSETIGERFKNSTKLTVENGSHNDLIEVDVLEQLIQFIQYGSIEKDTIERSFDFLPPVDYQYNLIDTLEAIRINEGILSAMEKYKDLRAKHKYQEDYYYDISERNLNKYGFQLLNQDQHDDAMVVFKLSNKLHPDSQYSYSSLASGFVAQGEFESALIHFRKAVEIDYLNGYTRSQLSELEQKLR